MRGAAKAKPGSDRVEGAGWREYKPFLASLPNDTQLACVLVELHEVELRRTPPPYRTPTTAASLSPFGVFGSHTVNSTRISPASRARPAGRREPFTEKMSGPRLGGSPPPTSGQAARLPQDSPQSADVAVHRRRRVVTESTVP